MEAFGESYLINNPEKLTLHRFSHIFHQVRHPLRVVSTLWSRCRPWDRYWVWISRLRGFELLTAKMDPKVTHPLTLQPQHVTLSCLSGGPCCSICCGTDTSRPMQT